MTKKWKRYADKGKTFTFLLSDTLKTFDCLPYDPIIAKFNADDFSVSSTTQILGYLSRLNKERE